MYTFYNGVTLQIEEDIKAVEFVKTKRHDYYSYKCLVKLHTKAGLSAVVVTTERAVYKAIQNLPAVVSMCLLEKASQEFIDKCSVDEILPDVTQLNLWVNDALTREHRSYLAFNVDKLGLEKMEMIWGVHGDTTEMFRLYELIMTHLTRLEPGARVRLKL